MRRAIPAACLGLALALPVAGCGGFPQLDARVGPAARNAPYPAILPLSQVLDGPAGEVATDPDAAARADAALAARAAALRARAARLWGAPLEGG